MSLGSEQSLVGTLSFFGAAGWPFGAFFLSLFFLIVSHLETGGIDLTYWSWGWGLELGVEGG